MSREAIEFREGTATQEDIQAHLEGCDADFSPRLSLKVDIGEYSRKISARAKTRRKNNARMSRLLQEPIGWRIAFAP